VALLLDFALPFRGIGVALILFSQEVFSSTLEEFVFSELAFNRTIKERVFNRRT
jgi:hypothetical protein